MIHCMTLEYSIAILKENILWLLQFQVAAYDSQDPTRRTTSQVTVEVTRNPSGPSFLSGQYETTIAETYPLGEGVINATAVDRDGVRAY